MGVERKGRWLFEGGGEGGGGFGRTMQAVDPWIFIHLFHKFRGRLAREGI